MSETCSTQEGYEKCMLNAGRKKIKEREYLGDLSLEILYRILQKQDVKVRNHIHVTQQWIQLRVFMNTVIKFRVP